MVQAPWEGPDLVLSLPWVPGPGHPPRPGAGPVVSSSQPHQLPSTLKMRGAWHDLVYRRVKTAHLQVHEGWGAEFGGKQGKLHLLSPCYMPPTGLAAFKALPLLILRLGLCPFYT